MPPPPLMSKAPNHRSKRVNVLLCTVLAAVGFAILIQSYTVVTRPDAGQRVLQGVLDRTKASMEIIEPGARKKLLDNDLGLGHDHRYTLRAAQGLADILSLKGDFAEAEALHRRTLEGQLRSLGPGDPATLYTMDHFAMFLYHRRNFSGAEPICRLALETREQKLGIDHPDTLTSVNDLAWLLREKGDPKSAEPLFRRALAGRERVLGVEHADTLFSLIMLGKSLEDQGNLKEAEFCLDRAVQGLRNTLGPKHPKTRIYQSSLERLRLEMASKKARK